MTTTSLKLPEDLKERIAAAAEHRGTTPHAFMVDALRRAADAAEQRASFVADALEAEQEMLDTGLGYDPREVHEYLMQRARGVRVPQPKAKRWRA